MAEFFRESPLGQIIRLMTGNKVLKYPEEKDDFICPNHYHESGPRKGDLSGTSSASNSIPSEARMATDQDFEAKVNGLGTVPTQPDLPMAEKAQSNAALESNLSRVMSRPMMNKVSTRADLEEAYREATHRDEVEKGPSQPIVPVKTADGITLVDWYTTDDPENPQNWSRGKKLFVVLQIYLYTLAVYMGSSIYTSSESDVVEIFGVSSTAASLGLALYVLGYGTGPMIFSPISEIPAIGRNPPYILTFGLFVILCVPTSLVDNFGGFLVLRFLLGFFGSPCLATGGASIGDLYTLLWVPFGLLGWTAFATGGPSLGPLISGFSVPAENWRWSQWELLWLSGPIFLLLVFCLPETSSPTILLRRAQRLRKLTGNPGLKSQSEIDQSKLSLGHVVVETLWRPMQINLLDPAVLFSSVYTSIVYGIYYSFFEVFPLVYVDLHGFNEGELGLVFLSVLVGLAIAMPIYGYYLNKVFQPEIRAAGGPGIPERRLIPGIYASFLPPIGLFMFGWTGVASIHWIVPTIGIVIYNIGVLIIMQCIFIYIPLSYPQFAASMYAANDLFRSCFAAGAIMYSSAMYVNLGIGQGCSLLAGLCVGCVGGMFALYIYGGKLRARSKFTVK